jgi:hypothetical protein
MAVLQNNILAGAAGSGGAAADAFQIKQSLRFDESASSRLDKTFYATGNQTTWTWSGWFKRGKNDHYGQLFTCSTASNNYTQVYVENTGQFVIASNTTAGGNRYLVSHARLRDPTAWYHLVAVFDTNNATSTDRMRLYVNGKRLTHFSNTSYPNSGTLSNVNSTNQHSIGSVQPLGSNGKLDGYLAEVHFVDGQALEPTSFGAFDDDTGVWNPIEFTGNHNTAGVTHWRQADSSDAPSGDSNAQNYRTQRAFEDPQPTALVWDHQATETIGLQNITGVTSLRLKLNSVGNAKLAINGGALFSVGNHGTSTSYPPSESQASWYTISNPPSTLTSISATGGGSGTGNWASVWAIEVNGNRVVDIPAGVNGFHLDFDPTAGVIYSDAVLNAGNDPANLFDGGTSNYVEGSTDGTPVTWSGNVTGINKLEFYGNQAGTNRTFSVNGVDKLSLVPTSPGWFTVPNVTTLTAFSYSRGASGNYVDLFAVRVNGAILADHSAPGADASGNRNHWTPTNLVVAPAGNFDLSTASLNPWGGASYVSGRDDISMAFDGSPDSYLLLNNQNNHGIDFSPGISVSSKVEIWGLTSNQSVTTNLNSSGVQYTPGQWTTVYQGTGTLTSITMQSNNNRPALARIRVDGVELIGRGLDTDVLTDSPTDYDDGTNIGGNYATLNPLMDRDGQTITLSNGNLSFTSAASSGQYGTRVNNFGVTSGKWYAEFTVKVVGNGVFIGVTRDPDGDSNYIGGHSASYGYLTNGQKYNNNSSSSYGASYTAGDVIGIALDMDNNTVAFYKNGSSQGTAFSSLAAGTYFMGISGAVNAAVDANFGQSQFKISSVPTGFKTLCTKNLPDPDIEDPSDHFDIKLWSGNGGRLVIGDPVYSSSADSGITNAANIFNGSTSNGGYFPGTGTNKVLTTSPFTINTSLRVYQNFRSDGTYAICLNDSCISVAGSGTNSTVFRWSTVDLSSFTLPLDVTKLGYSLSQNSGNTIMAVEVDGTILVDGGSDGPLEFSPDLVWVKRRNAAIDNLLFDSLRGFGANKELVSNDTYTEGMTGLGNPNTDVWGYVDSVTNNGFVVEKGSHSTGNAANTNGEPYVGWVWNGGNLINTFNTSTHDQSQVWSSLATLSGGSTASGKGLVNGFDGTTTTATEGDSNNEYLELPISTTIASGGVRVYAAVTSSNPLYINLYNGSSNVQTITGSNSGGQWYATTYAGPITKIRIERGGRPFEFNAVEVNGKILTNAGLIAVGGLNSSVYDQSQNWTNNVSSTSNITSGQESRLFNGSLTGSGADIQSSQGTSGVINFTNAITGSKIEIFTIGNVGEIGINGGNLTVTANQWVDTGVTSLTSVETRHPGAGLIQNPSGLRVDGKILVDSGLSVTNVPTVASTVTANTTAGMSIVTASPNNNAVSIAHGLNAAPSLIISKSRTVSYDWNVYHGSLGGNSILRLNTEAAIQTVSNYWNNVNSSTFSVTSGNNANNSGDMLYYCFSPVAGYSAVGTFEGTGNTNGSTNGPYVHLGFRPRFLLMKNADLSSQYEDWMIVDADREPGGNPTATYLLANETNGEADNTNIVDFLSNGFKVRNADSTFNGNGNTIVYYAVAENPFKISRAR